MSKYALYRHIPLDTKLLRRESRRLLVSGGCLGMLFLALLAVMIRSERTIAPTADTPSSLRVQIISVPKPPPQIQNPFINWRRTSPQKSLVRRTFRIRQPEIFPNRQKSEDPNIYRLYAERVVREFTERIDNYFDESQIVIEHTIPRDLPDITLFTELPIPEIQTRYGDLAYDRRPPEAISLTGEMVTVDDLDTGRYKGLIVVDTTDLLRSEGFLHIPAAVHGATLTPPESLPKIIEGLTAAIAALTGIRIEIDGRLNFDSPYLRRYPFIVIAADDIFEATDTERAALASYFAGGGFAFIESYGRINPSLPPRGAPPLRSLLNSLPGVTGGLSVIPNDHLLYDIAFPFPDGPPRTAGTATRVVTIQQRTMLEGVFIDDRLVAVYSEKEYGPMLIVGNDSEAARKLIANMVILAMVQRGGTTRKFVDYDAWKDITGGGIIPKNQ